MTLPSLRSLTKLYGLDRPFAWIANFTGIVSVCGITLVWASAEVKTIATFDHAGIDMRPLPWATAACLVLMMLGLVLLLRRYRWIHRVVSHGITIKGLIEKFDVSTRQLPAEKHAPWTPRLSHTYYAVVAYDCRGVTRKARLKLPTLPPSTTIREGAEIDLLVLPSSPARPLIRKIFENWAHTYG